MKQTIAPAILDGCQRDQVPAPPHGEATRAVQTVSIEPARTHTDGFMNLVREPLGRDTEAGYTSTELPMALLDWLFGKKPSAEPPDPVASLAAEYPDDPTLSVAARIERAVYRHQLGELPSFGADGLDALVACLSSKSGMTLYGAEAVLSDKIVASQATPALAAALDDPGAVLARAASLRLLAKVDEGQDPRSFVYKKVLKVLAHRGDERGVPAVVRLYKRNDAYREIALAALEGMLKRKRVYAHLGDEQLSELGALPDLSRSIVGEEADRFATGVYWGERTISCEGVRELARKETQRRAQRA